MRLTPDRLNRRFFVFFFMHHIYLQCVRCGWLFPNVPFLSFSDNCCGTFLLAHREPSRTIPESGVHFVLYHQDVAVFISAIAMKS